MIRHYVKAFSPGIIAPEISCASVSKRDAAITASNASSYVYAFRFFDRMEVEASEKGNSETVTLRSDEINESPLYVIDGVVMSLRHVERRVARDLLLTGTSDFTTLLGNLLSFGANAVIKCRNGNHLPAEDDIILISSTDGSVTDYKDVIEIENSTPSPFIVADLSENGSAVFTLPCGDGTVTLSREEITRAYGTQHTCGSCFSSFTVAAVPDTVLRLIGSYTRNEPGKLLVTVFQ